LTNNFTHYLDVIVVLAQKDFKIRYRNSVLGFLWSLLNPLASMTILTVVFSFLLRVSVPNFAAWVLIGLLIWRFFSIGSNQGLFAIVGNASLVSKVYIPRYVIVLSSNVANLIGASLEFAVLLPLLVLLGVSPTVGALLLFAILALEFLLIFGISLSLSSLNLKYRDFYQLWDLALQLGFWLCPIAYNVSLIPERFRTVYLLNPITRLMESTRGVLLTHQFPSLSDYGVILLSVAISLAVGFLVFRRLEGRFAEEL
jgi:lipopolysaccharide transport system permease protein